MAVTTKSVAKLATAVASDTDAFSWTNPYGGSWSTLTNWFDSTTNAAATVGPDAKSTVSIVGGVGSLTIITGNGTAKQLSISNDVLLWGGARLR